MATKNIYANYNFDGNSDISGVTAVHITENATLSDQAVRLEQLTSGLATKQDTLTAGDAINATAFGTGTIDVLFDNSTIGLNGSNQLFVPNGGIDEAQLNSNVDAETFLTTAHAWNNATGGTIQQVLEDLDDAITTNALTIAPSSQDLLEISANQLSVKQLLVTDVTVDSTATGLTEWVTSNYTGTELQEGDILILTNATSEDDRTWIHNGGTGGTVADFTKVTSTLDSATIRALFSGGDALTYNPATGNFDVNVDNSTIEVNGSDQLQVVANGINSTHINWAIGSTDADDIPVIDVAANFTGSTVEQVLAELQDNIDAIVTEPLSDTLAAGNTTSGNDIVMSAGDTINGAGTTNILDLNASGAWTVNNNAAYTTSWVYGDATTAQLGWGGTAYVEANDGDALMTTVGAFVNGSGSYMSNQTIGTSTSDISSTIAAVKLQSIASGSVSNGIASARALFLNSGGATAGVFTSFDAGVTNSVAVGGVDMTITKNNSAYMNIAAFQEAGNANEICVIPAAGLTTGYTQTLQAKDGTIALLSDIVADDQTLQEVMDLGSTATGLSTTVTIENTVGGDTNNLDMDADGARLRHTTGAGSIAEFSAFDSSTFVAYETTGATVMSIDLSETAGTVTDTINSKGLEYAADYSANFTANSLITKSYADAVKTDSEFSSTVSLTANTPLAVSHNLGTQNVIYQVWASDGSEPEIEVTNTDANTITLESNSNLTNIDILVYAFG